MNYYEHHIRDYDAATAHLSWDEDMAYTRLLRWYYRKEQPIPADIKEACRQVRAATKAQRDAVAAVLKEFFVLRDDGWHQETCDEAITTYQAGEPEREVKKANEENRLRRHRDERARLFKVLTDAGEHAPWNIKMEELRALVGRISSANPATAPATQNSTPETLPATAPATPATATQTPDTNHQTPDIKENTPHNPPAGGCTGTLTEKKAKVKAERMTLKTFLDRCRETGEKPISDYEPLARYMAESGLPADFVNLCWQEFRREFLPGGRSERKQQAQWRRHFQNFVERNFFRLWYAKPQGDGVAYELTTVGLQAQIALQRREAA